MLSLLDRDPAVSVSESRDPLATPASPRPRPRMPVSAGMVVSVVFHSGIALLSLSLVNLQKPTAPASPLAASRLVSIVYLPSVPLELETLNLPEIAEPKVVVPPEPVPEPPVIPERKIETAVVEPPIAKPLPPVTEGPRPAPPAPPPPTPTVGSFPEATAAARIPVPTSRRVEDAGFNPLVKETPESRLGQATVGAFDSAPAAGARQATRSVVAESGFGRSSTAAAPARPTGVVRGSGFGETAAPERPKSVAPAEVKAAGFANAAETEAPRRVAAAPVAPPTTPVEVISKPTPVYTEQARNLKIEGEVVLEVDFSASGSLRVVRVVKGLGHGLDEAAMKAAEQIRFKPAISHGRAVDYRANVHIVFRLA